MLRATLVELWRRDVKKKTQIALVCTFFVSAATNRQLTAERKGGNVQIFTALYSFKP